MIFKKVEMTMLSFPFLLAMTPGGTCFSAVANKNVCSDKVLKSCDKSFVVKSNDNQSNVASVDFSCELFQMNNASYGYTHYTSAYSFVYRAQIHLYTGFSYKGGIFNWFDGADKFSHIKKFYIAANFKYCGTIGNSFQYPNGEGFRVMRDVNPCVDSRDNCYNCIDGILSENSLGGNFDTAVHLNSSSYSMSVEGAKKNNVDYDSRISAYVLTSLQKTGDSLNFAQNFDYGYDWSNYKRYLFNAGPTLEEKRFDFSIYGAMNFEATELPSNNTITLSLETMNGLDNVPLNCFEASNTATITF